MLILQRKEGESLFIGEDIEVTVLSVEGNRVRLALEAPKNIVILRSELKKAAEANQAAAEDTQSPLVLLDVLKAEPKEKPETAEAKETSEN